MAKKSRVMKPKKKPLRNVRNVRNKRSKPTKQTPAAPRLDTVSVRHVIDSANGIVRLCRPGFRDRSSRRGAG